MREIKFRVWNKSEKRMLNNPTIHLRTDRDFYVYGDFKPLEEQIGTYELMQFTGLKDKNGKEIYEGDIVTSYNKNRCVVEWLDGAGGFLFEQCDAEINEVIGNIYENPELLKK